MSDRPMIVELQRCAVGPAGASETYHFSFPWSRGKRSWPAFIRPEHMPEADVTADWDFAWFEVAKVNGVWTGLRRMAQRRGDEAWSSESPNHASTGGSARRAAPAHST